MAQRLANNPNATFIFSHDGAAEKILFDLGLLGELAQQTGPGTKYVLHREHPTHFIFGILHKGPADAQLWEIEAVCFSKTEYPWEVVMTCVSTILARFGATLAPSQDGQKQQAGRGNVR